MKDIQNKEELVMMLDLYKQGKITISAMELELTKAAVEKTGQETVQVKIVQEVDATTNTTFGVVSLPEKIGEKLLLTVIIDKDAITNLLSPAEVVDIMCVEIESYQKTLREYSKFLKSKDENEMSISDALLFFLGLYKDSIGRIEEKHPEVFKRLRESRTIQSVQSLESEVKALEDGSEPLMIIERLTLGKKMPQRFVEVAKELAKVSKDDITTTSKVPLFYRDDEPVMNQFYQQRRALSDGTYDIEKNKSQIIDHKYVPKTN
jgi:hypothetical protein